MSAPSRFPYRPPYAHPGILGLVFLGGAFGTSIRAVFESAVPTSSGGFPLATFIINLTGSFILGVFYAWLPLLTRRTTLQRRLRPFIGAGLMGGYTTYSTFIVESYGLANSQHALVALAYVIISVICGIALAASGAWLVRIVGRHWATTQAFDSTAAGLTDGESEEA